MSEHYEVSEIRKQKNQTVPILHIMKCLGLF